MKKHGHWKDIGFRLTGQAVQSYTQMFVYFWNTFSNDPIPGSRMELPMSSASSGSEKGCVFSYYDSPLNGIAISNELYTKLQSIATESAWFDTPYLMLGESLIRAFVRTGGSPWCGCSDHHARDRR
ncbi:MAG: hypothetical protein Q3Y08_02485 [Butyricicoccus sp.]|nr:hypothetical protein [Butyricicoccus sp.]